MGVIILFTTYAFAPGRKRQTLAPFAVIPFTQSESITVWTVRLTSELYLLPFV
jgi:hypothetical protein